LIQLTRYLQTLETSGRKITLQAGSDEASFSAQFG
jgi:hypothetical protein